MIFSFEKYLSVNLYVPIGLGLFLLVLVVIFLSRIVLMFHSQPDHILRDLLITTILLVFLVIQFVRTISLIPLGFQLMKDKSESPILAMGYIESIEDVPIRPGEKYSYEGEVSWGAELTIDSEKYKVATHGALRVGDRVVFQYLPNSHFILSIFSEDMRKERGQEFSASYQEREP